MGAKRRGNQHPSPSRANSGQGSSQAVATMERGGLTSLCANIRATHASSRLSWPFCSRPGGSTWQHSGSLSRGPTLVQLFPRIRSNCQSCNRFGVKGNLKLHDGVQRSSLMASGSFESNETKLENEESLNTEKLLVDCEEDQECVVGGIVALGKFDALHIGHRQLAVHASKSGTPFLLSFVGMAEVLGWEPRPPIVAQCDRKRVLSTWAPFCGGMVPLECQVEFSKVRYLTPRQFVEKLSQELRVSGVVAGENYRFGYKAAGDAVELVKLCKEYNLKAFIVSSVMDKAQKCHNGSGRGVVSPNDKGQVSSSRVRQALYNGDMAYVSELLGRKHRLVMEVNDMWQVFSTEVSIPKSCMLNQPPVEGMYENCAVFVNEELIGSCQVVIDTQMVQIKSKDGTLVRNVIHDCKVLGVEFG